MDTINRLIKVPVLLLILLFVPVTAVSAAHAAKPLPFNSQARALVEDTFFKDGRPSAEKIKRYHTLIRQRYKELEQNLRHYYKLLKDHSKKKTKKKIKAKDDIKAYKILLDTIKRLKQQLDTPVAFQRTALQILHLDYALKIQARKLASTELIEKIPFGLRGKKIPLRRTPNGEASNLVRPARAGFYSQQELRDIKRRGGDISKLNPPPDSPLWTDHAVSHIDVSKHYTTGQDALHKGMEIIFPEKKAYFDKVRKTQSKPKLDLYIRHNGKKLEFKLKIGAEVHSESTCSALFSAIGYSTDITKYTRDFKVVLGETTYDQFRREWMSYFSGYDPDKYIKSKGTDEEGHYLIFHDGLLEAKPPGLIRVGPWALGANGNGGLREVRGMLLFDMWVSNLDLKEWENNKLILRKSGDGYRFFQIQHDMGFAFGKTYMERPGSFKWQLVKKRTNGAIHMNYNALMDNSLFRYITYADARWAARLIARLSRRQISDAVALGGWPDALGKLLVEKLIARRNQLVKVFGLIGETTPEGETIAYLDFDRRLTTADGAVKNGKLKRYRYDGYPQYFGPRVNEILALILKGIRNGVVDTMVGFAGSIRYIVIDPEKFGLDRRIVSKIFLRMDREIEQNPLPANAAESFLVKDTMSLGFRLGYGSVISGDLGYWRKYTLVYPVETRDAGRFHDGFIMNLLIPLKNRTRNLPANHVVMLEDYVEGRGKLSIPVLNDMLEFAVNASQLYLSRKFIRFRNSQKGRQVIFFRDKSLYNELRLRVFFELFNFFRSTPFLTHIQKGSLDRDYVELNISGPEDDPQKRKALDQLLLEGDPTLLEQIGRRRRFHDRFLEKKSDLKLLGLIRRRSVYRVDRVKEKDTSETGDRHYLQVESRKLKSWRFMDNGERHFSSIQLTGRTDGREKVNDPVLTLSLQVNDKSTHDGELKHGYLDFINTVALDRDFIPFDSPRHTVNRLWGPMQFIINVILYEEAIRNLVQADEAAIWRALAEVSGMPEEYLRGKAEPVYRRGRPVPGQYSKDQYLAVKTRYFIRELRRARRSKNDAQKMAHVVKAVRKTVYTSSQTYSPTLLSVIHKLAGEGNIFISALVTAPENKELLLPARAPLYNELGARRKIEAPVFQFIFDDPSEVYHLF